MKKPAIVAVSLVIGLITVLYINEFVKGIAASLLLGKDIEYLFNGIILTAVIPFTKENNLLVYWLIFLIPLLLSMIWIELSSLSLKRIVNLNFRTNIIIFELVNIGFIVVNVFVGILSVLLKNSFTSGWTKLFSYGEFTFEKQLIVMMLVLILSLVYVNFTANRLKNYLTIIKQK